MIGSLIQGFKQQIVEDSNHFQEAKVSLLPSKNDSQAVNVEIDGGRDVSQKDRPGTIPIKDILEDIKVETIIDSGARQDGKHKINVDTVGIGIRGVSKDDDRQTVPSKGIEEEIREDSREIFIDVSKKKGPLLAVDQVQSGQPNTAKQPTQSNQSDQPEHHPEQTQTESTIPFKCDNVGRFAHPNNCQKYYFCFNKNEVHKVFDCPHHLAFDPITRTCVHNFAVCASAPKCDIGKRILPNVNDKSTYFECKFRHLSKNVVLRMRNCAAGREFDAELGYCKSKFLNDDFPSDESNSSEDMECEQVGIFTDYLNDFGYYECVVKSVSNGTLKLIRHSCPAYHMFVQSKQRCIPYLVM